MIRFLVILCLVPVALLARSYTWTIEGHTLNVDFDIVSEGGQVKFRLNSMTNRNAPNPDWRIQYSTDPDFTGMNSTYGIYPEQAPYTSGSLGTGVTVFVRGAVFGAATGPVAGPFGADAITYRVTFRIPAGVPGGRVYEVYKNGVPTGITTNQDNGSPSRSFTATGLSEGGNYTLVEKTSALTQDPATGIFQFTGGTYVRQVSGNVAAVVETSPVTLGEVGSVSSPGETSVDGKPAAPGVLDKVTNSSGSVVWSNSTAVTGNNTNGLTLEGYREGVNELLKANYANTQQIVVATNNLASGLTGINQTLASIDGHVVFVGNQVQTVSDKLELTNLALGNVTDNLTAIDQFNSQVLAQKTLGENATALSGSQSTLAQGQISSAISGNVQSFDPLGVTVSDQSNALKLTLPRSLGEIDLDPNNHPETRAAAIFVKGLIAFLLVGLFQWWLLGWFKEVYFTAAASVQAKGNPVLAGTGAQATSLAAAIVITGILVSVPGIFWAQVNANIDLFGLGASANPSPLVSPSSSFVSVALYLWETFFPVQTFMAILGQLFVIKKFGILLVAGIQTAIRFVIP